ncbi:hypothetical protein [Bacillus thuringiensis]|nr:hypothetical protein [Bacillus thuringiensis]
MSKEGIYTDEHMPNWDSKLADGIDQEIKGFEALGLGESVDDTQGDKE